jgi:hypothetical protein
MASSSRKLTNKKLVTSKSKPLPGPSLAELTGAAAEASLDPDPIASDSESDSGPYIGPPYIAATAIMYVKIPRNPDGTIQKYPLQPSITMPPPRKNRPQRRPGSIEPKSSRPAKAMRLETQPEPICPVTQQEPLETQSPEPIRPVTQQEEPFRRETQSPEPIRIVTQQELLPGPVTKRRSVTPERQPQLAADYDEPLQKKLKYNNVVNNPQSPGAESNMSEDQDSQDRESEIFEFDDIKKDDDSQSSDFILQFSDDDERIVNPTIKKPKKN